MKEERASRRYAQALFEVATKHNLVATVESDLAAIESAFLTDDEFRLFLTSPYRSREEKLDVLGKVFADKVTALTLQLVRVMIDKRREYELGSIRKDFSALRREHDGILYAQVTSAIELDASQMDAIVSSIGGQLNKKIEADFKVDPTLVGGVKVAYDEFVLDGSVKGTFKRLKEAFRRENLKKA